MKKAHCLNCDALMEKHFCSNCGQKTDTHRITLKHFLLHDLLHGLWHLEKGILFTIKETFTRPGQAALDYIHGKRVRYYNVFYLALLIIGANLLLGHWYQSIHPVTNPVEDDTIEVTQFFRNNLKIILLSIVPILGLMALLVFKRLKLNLAEHFIISGIALLGILILSVLFNFINFINTYDIPISIALSEVVVFLMMLLFPVWVYYNAGKGLYNFWEFLWRIIVFYLAVLLILSLLLGGIVYYLTNGKGELYISV